MVEYSRSIEKGECRMITGELKRQVDKIWDTLWTAGITSPVTVMEHFHVCDPKKPTDRAEHEIASTWEELKEMLSGNAKGGAR